MSINIGICGFGKMGQIRADAIAEHGGNLVVSKIFDEALRADSPYPAAASVDEIVNDPDIDAVILCLPNFLNYPTTLTALKAGKHVFCEKPPAFTAAEVEEIRAVERAAGKILMYGFNHRHHDAVVEMHKQIAQGEHGRMLWMRGRYGKSVDADFLNTWRADPELAGGGILLDQGIHMLDLMLFLSGKPFDEVNAMVSNLYWKTPGIEDNVFAIFRNSGTGLCASIHSTMTQWRHLFSLEVFLERGYMVLNGLKTSSGTYGEEILTIAKNRARAPAATWDDEERYQFEVDTSWGREIEHFAACIATGAPVEYGSSRHALEVMQLVDRIYAHERHIGDNLHTDLGGGARSG